MKKLVIATGLLLMVFCGSAQEKDSNARAGKGKRELTRFEKILLNLIYPPPPEPKKYSGIFVDLGAYNVLFKDSSTMQKVNGFILADSVTREFYLEYSDKRVPKSDPNRIQKIYADETISITRVFDTEPWVTGVSLEGVWLFPKVKGWITLYTFYTMDYDHIEIQLVGMKIGNGMIMPLNPESLEKEMAAHPDLVKLIKKGKYVRAAEKYNERLGRQTRLSI